MIEKKLLFLFAVFSVVIAVPSELPPKLIGSEKLRVEKFVKELQLSAKNEAKPAATTLNERSFRLPNNTEPISYNLSLSTDIHRGDFAFQGDVSINIRALEATNNITLHSRHTIIERIDLFNPNGTLYQANLFYTYDSELQFLVIPFTRELEAGQELRIDISYQGFIRTGNGFFSNSYYDPETDEQTWLATTQFPPVHARHAFPSFDEPKYHAPIILQIRHHQSYHAISNMPIAERRETDNEYVITIFEETPPIATYTFAFTISKFGFIETYSNYTNIPVRVYARPEAIQLGQVDDALRLGEALLTEVVRFFEIPFPLPKSDQVAIPLLPAGGFESWGLIQHTESIILQLNNNSDAQYLRELRVGHEHIHIYFSNLVTPSSWSYLWLNEGIATHYENIFYSIINPHPNPWDGWQIFLREYFDIAINVDVNGLLPSLNTYAETPEEIEAKYNFGTFIKGAIVLRMFREGMPTATWNKGLRYYILDRQFDNASPEDLFAALQRSYDEDFPGTGRNFAEIMSPWFDLAGYPVVTVTRTEQGLLLSQEGFRTLHDEIFPIPINYATASVPSTAMGEADFYMTTRQMNISRDTAPKTWTDNDWIIINLRDTGYYLTNYDNISWNLIIDALNYDHNAIGFLNRGTFFADFHRFIAQDFNISITLFLRMMESLPLEFEPHVWNRAGLGLNLAEVRFRATEFSSQYRDFVRDIMGQIYGQRSFDDRNAIDLINEWSCLSGVQACLNDALNVLIEVMQTGHTDYPFNFQCNALRAANEVTWLNFYISVIYSNGDRSDTLRDLLCTPYGVLIDFYLEQALNPTNTLSNAEREVILTSAAVQSETSYNALIYLIQRYPEQINSITSVSNLVLQLALVTNTYIQAETVLNLLQFATDDVITEEFIVEIIQPNQNFIYRNTNELLQWFNRRHLNVK